MRRVTFPVYRKNKRLGAVVGLGPTVKKAASAGKSILRSLGITKSNPAAATNRKRRRKTSRKKPLNFGQRMARLRKTRRRKR